MRRKGEENIEDEEIKEKKKNGKSKLKNVEGNQKWERK